MDGDEQQGAITTVTSSVEVPGDVIVEGTMLVTSYIASDGTQRYAWRSSGGFSLAQGIGLLEIVKQHMFAEAGA